MIFLQAIREGLARWLGRGGEPSEAAEIPSTVPAVPTGFDWRSYLERYPDLQRAGIDTREKAEAHWLDFGKAEGRLFLRTRRSVPREFDWLAYLERYPDLKAAGIDSEERAVGHWLAHGEREGRLCAPVRGEVPIDFDWRSYLERYPDLGEAGIDTRRKAIEHWLRRGEGEGRWCTAPSYSTRFALTCKSMHSMFLRATGDLTCWDDGGNEQILQRFDDRVHYGHQVYLGPAFNYIRQRLWEGELPWKCCQRCLVLDCGSEHSSFHVDRRVVELLQIEPSFKCTLDCPGCIPLEVRRLAPPRNLDPIKMQKVLEDLVDAGIDVRAFDFQGHGEPLLHPGLWDLARMIKRSYPRSYLTMTTNAHGAVKEKIFNSGIDEVVCSIDGISQETYEPYRVHGRFELAFRFMRDLVRGSAHRGRRTKVIWKYVLFEHNSSPEHLVAAQRMAAEAAVDELIFVFTRNGPRSLRVTDPSQVPRADTGVPVAFRYHEPEVAGLGARIGAARSAAAAGDFGRAANLILSIARSLDRFFPARQDLEPEHERLVAELRDLAAELSDKDRLAIREALRDLG